MDAVTRRTEMGAGWRLVLTGFVGLSLGTTGIFFYTQGLFIRPLQAEFGWSRAQAAAMPTMFGLALAVSYPLSGVLLDRFGNRAVAIASILSLSAGLFGLSRMTGDLASYIAITLFIALCGSGTATAYVRLIGGGFHRSRGLALGLAMTGTGLVALFVPGLLGFYLERHGWRAAYQLLAMLALLALPLVVLFAGRPTVRPGAAPAAGMTLGEAISTRRFWRMAGGFACAGAAVSGMMAHLIPMMQDLGMSAHQAGALFGAVGLGIIVGRLMTGVLCDHLFAPLVAAAVLSLSALGLLGLALVGPAVAAPAAALIGLGLGAEIDLAGYMSARYFGLRAYGSILGVQFGLFGCGSGIGALSFGLLYGHFGNYRIALIAAAGLLVLSIIAALRLGPYPDRSASTVDPASGGRLTT